MIKIGIQTPLGEEIRVGDILQGKQSHPCIVIYDDTLNKYRASIIKVKNKIDIYGKITNANINYGFVFNIEEFLDSHPDTQVIGNILMCTHKDMDKAIFNPVSDWKILKLEGGNYNG